MKISVVTVAYNCENQISRTIESLLAQEITADLEIEYLVIDGKSSDATVERAEGYRRALENKGIEIRICSEPDQGIYNAMNKGAGLAGGEVIGFLNCGDWYEADTLKTVRDTFLANSCDLMFADIRIHKTNGTSFIKKARLRRFQTSRDWNHPTTFVKTTLMRQNPFRELGIHDDYGFYLRMRRQGKRIVTVDRVLANFLMGGASNQKELRAAFARIRDRYRYCYRINGYSRFYLLECVAQEAAKLLLG